MRNQIHDHAPYTYLTQFEPGGLFHLFVTVPVREGYTLTGLSEGGIQYLNGMTKIDLRVVQKAGQAATSINLHFPLGENDTDAARFNSDTDEILVTVSVFETDELLESEHYSTTLYRDADDQFVSDEELAANVVFNSPYVYLKNAALSADENFAGLAFEPYLLMHLNGYVQNPDQINITTPDNGVYEAIIVLSKTQERINEPFTEYNFAVNGNHYYDSGRIEGNFAITVILEENVAASESLSRQPAAALHEALWEIDNSPGSRGMTAADNGGRNTTTPIRKKAKTRNMSSRRRSSILLDINSPKG